MHDFETNLQELHSAYHVAAADWRAGLDSSSKRRAKPDEWRRVAIAFEKLCNCQVPAAAAAAFDDFKFDFELDRKSSLGRSTAFFNIKKLKRALKAG